MANLPGPAPVGGTSLRADHTPAEGPTARAARLFNRELGELNHQQRVAHQSGQVVTEAQITVEYESQGPRLVARDASRRFSAREPLATVPAGDGEAGPVAPEDPGAAAAVLSARPSAEPPRALWDQVLRQHQPLAPAAAPPEAPSLDSEA